MESPQPSAARGRLPFVSSKPGRNDPCSCGSGKKYKRCCLSADEAAARERAQQQALFDDALFGDTELDLDDEEDESFDVEDVSALDRRAITRVCYTRGFVSKLSERRSGRGMRVTEWEAPHIPETVLDSIEREAVDALEGIWGNPKIGDPIQVDVIDVETETDFVSVELFNRAICLVHEDSSELQRLHRTCGTLEAAVPGGPDRSAAHGDAAPAVAVVESTERSPSPAGFDLSGVLKEHRRQGGTCALCGHAVTRASARKHLAACTPAHDATVGPAQRLVHVRATTPGLPAYWLDVEVGVGATLDALDAFLRQIWLECCGHLSAFHIGATRFFSRGYDFGFARSFGGFGRQQPAERTMKVKVGAVLTTAGESFEYEYDFGSTTSVLLRVTGERMGRLARPPVRLLVRNAPPVWPCATCGQAAAVVCAFCIQDEGNPFACMAHLTEHACG